MPQNCISIAYCFDEGYASFAKIAMFTLVAASATPLKIFLITNVNSEQAREEFRNICRDRPVELYFANIPTEVAQRLPSRGRFSGMAFAKLAIPALIREPKVIYLDVDTVVRTDLRPLFEMPLGNRVVAGVVDPVGARTSRMPLQSLDTYINTGVLLMDLDALRSFDFLGQCCDIEKRWEAIWPDQCVLNKCLEGQVLLVDQRWNRQVFSDKVTAKDWDTIASPQNSSILHFLGDAKPWSAWCSPLISEFWWSIAPTEVIGDLKPTPLTNLNQLIRYADALHRAERYEHASRLKSEAISHLTTSKKP